LGRVTGELEKQVLKGVSRSFYLTLRLLPERMRGAASLGYLLARTSDTLADSTGIPVAERVDALGKFAAAVADGGDAPEPTPALVEAVADERERRLLGSMGQLLDWLRKLPAAEADLVREVVATIISGQVLDLERFADSSASHPVALESDAALEDYAWRVAGCVGAFWTKLGFLTLGESFSREAEDVLLGRGVSYGKGLQLVNILRDVGEDLGNGRCYLPVSDPGDTRELLACHRRWVRTAREWCGEGESYARTLHSRRLRAATVLPALIARETLEPLGSVMWSELQERVKVPRSKVYGLMLRAFLSPSPGA
jgi:farnesyl-diphosphate farnesyltransferase